jgi:YQGE family putative transporter
MNRNERLTLFIYACFSFSSAVSTVFASMYLYRYLDSIAALSVFNLFQFGLMPLGFYVAGRAARRIGKKATLIAGLVLFVVFYALLVALGPRSARYLYLLGGVNGLANGLYWFSFNVIITDITSEATRGRFFGAYGALGAAASAAAPAISSPLLEFAPNIEWGYSALFLCIIVVTVAMSVAASLLHVSESRERFTVLDKIRPGREPAWRFAILANLLYGIRDGAGWSIMSALVLKSAGNDVLAGELAVLFAISAAAANLVGARFLTPKRGLRFWLWGGVAGVASAVLLVAVPNPVGAAVSGTVWRAAEALVFLPFNVAVFGIFADYGKREGGIAGRNIAVETALNFGRAIGVLAFLGGSYLTPYYAELLFPLVTLFVPASFIVYKRYREIRA